MPVYLNGVGAREDCFGEYHALNEMAGLLQEHDPTKFDGKPQQGQVPRNDANQRNCDTEDGPVESPARSFRGPELGCIACGPESIEFRHCPLNL
jgi:hypothetical protein